MTCGADLDRSEKVDLFWVFGPLQTLIHRRFLKTCRYSFCSSIDQQKNRVKIFTCDEETSTSNDTVARVIFETLDRIRVEGWAKKCLIGQEKGQLIELSTRELWFWRFGTSSGSSGSIARLLILQNLSKWWLPARWRSYPFTKNHSPRFRCQPETLDAWGEVSSSMKLQHLPLGGRKSSLLVLFGLCARYA